MSKARYDMPEEYKCTVCNKFRYTIYRGQRMKKGHIKTMFCPFCNKERDLVLYE